MEGLLFFSMVLVGVLFMSMIGSWLTDNIDGLFLSAIGMFAIVFYIGVAATSGEQRAEHSILHPDQYEYAKTNHTVFIISDMKDLDDPEYNTKDTVVYNHIGDTSRVKVVIRNSINYMGSITWREVDIIVEN